MANGPLAAKWGACDNTVNKHLTHFAGSVYEQGGKVGIFIETSRLGVNRFPAGRRERRLESPDRRERPIYEV